MAFSNNHGVNRENNPYSFSENSKQIDNSHLQETTSEKFSNTKQKINNAQNENLEIGQSIIDKVKKEEDEGL